MNYIPNVDEMQCMVSVQEIALWMLNRLDKDPHQKWQFRMWQDEKDPKYLYLVGRVPPVEWGEE